MVVIGTWYQLMGHLFQIFYRPNTNARPSAVSHGVPAVSTAPRLVDDLGERALKVVFGMDSKGRIKKEKARCVVKQLGLVGEGDDVFGTKEGEEEEEELRVEEIVGSDDGEEADQDCWKQAELMRQAFMVFDRDGDGFIEASEVKRVLECLGLAKGWEMGEFEKMVQVVDLNSDGKVDFSEFELMMDRK